MPGDRTARCYVGKADGCGLAESCECGLPVVPGAWCLRGCCCCCRLVVAEVEWLRNDLLLGRSRLTEMMMGTMGWVADGQTGRRCVYVQCRLSVSGQTLFLRSTGSQRVGVEPPGAGESASTIAVAELPHTCTVPGVGRSVLRTEREREREADVDVDPCTCSNRPRLGSAWLLGRPNQHCTGVNCRPLLQTARIDGTRPSLLSALWSPRMTMKLRDVRATGKDATERIAHSPEVTVPPCLFNAGR